MKAVIFKHYTLTSALTIFDTASSLCKAILPLLLCGIKMQLLKEDKQFECAYSGFVKQCF